MTIGQNQRGTIAAELEQLARDRDFPVDIDGVYWDGSVHHDMEPGEAERIVVDVVLESEVVKGRLAEADLFWEGMKWMAPIIAGMDARVRPVPPEHLRSAILDAFAAAVADFDNTDVT